jgi:NTP pyrophosphatase (non-canonical NTP hydrolase)
MDESTFFELIDAHAFAVEESMRTGSKEHAAQARRLSSVIGSLDDGRSFTYNFPPTGWVGRATYGEQLLKIYEEVGELHDAIALNIGQDVESFPDQSDVRCELIDIVCACETFLRHYDKDLVDAAFKAVMEKNKARGYFLGFEED